MLYKTTIRLLARSTIRSPVICRCLASASSAPSSSTKPKKSSTPSAATEEFLARVGKGRKTSVVKSTKEGAEFYSDKPEYPPIVAPFENYGFDGMKREKSEFAEFVKAMPTVEEKIFAVNPYERPFTRGEITWHKDWMHPRQDPRAIYRVNSIPDHYNLLPFYQFITKTHCIDGLPKSIESISSDKEFEEFAPLALELIKNEQRSYGERQFSAKDYVYNIADQLTNAACSLFSTSFPHLAEAQVSRGSSLQSVWIRGGFKSLYPKDDVEPALIRHNWNGAILGDDRRRRGEFAFCLRENISVSVRNKHPLPEIIPIDHELCRTPIAPYVYPPLTLGLFPDKDGPTFWSPGYEYGDPYEFNAVQFYSIESIMPIISKFKAASQAECYEECLRAASVSLSFGTLIAEAHNLGFTQHNDLTHPLTTQLVLTDGQYWHFSVYQLNSIATINHWEESERPSNLVWCSGSVKLYDSIDQDGNFQGLNADVFKMVLRFLLSEPKERAGVDMRPYLLNKATADEASLKSAQSHARALNFYEE